MRPTNTRTTVTTNTRTTVKVQSRRGRQMRITLHTQREETIGEAAAHYARTLHTALLSAGAPGRVTTGQHHPDSPAAQEGPRAVWPFVSLRVGGHDVQTLCAHRHRHRPHSADLGWRHALPAHLGRHCRCVRCSDTRHCPQDHHPPARPTINTRCTRNAGATGIAPQHHSSTGSDPEPRTATGTPPMAPHARTTVSAGKNREDHHEQDEHHQQHPGDQH